VIISPPEIVPHGFRSSFRDWAAEHDYDDPVAEAEVLKDQQLSAPEKRIILSSWASDMFAIESCPALREIPGMDHPIRLADILAALRQLDGSDDDDPPRPGGVPMRLRRPWAAAEGQGA